MSLRRMSIELADEVIKIYTDLLLKREENNIHYYPYSALKGYDIFDIENALKLMTAYRVYNSKKINENKLAEFKKYASEDGGAIFTFFSSFIPNHLFKELIKFPYGSTEYRLREGELLYDDEMPKELRKFFVMNTETVDSFLDYCIKLGRDNPEYWIKVYSRLNLSYSQAEVIVKYLQFFNQNSINPFGDYFQIDYSFIIKDSLGQINNFPNREIKKITVKLTGREDASLRAQYDNYEIEPASFSIAKKFIVEKIEAGEEIKEKEEISDAFKYLNLDSESLEEFHTEAIKVEVLK